MSQKPKKRSLKESIEISMKKQIDGRTLFVLWVDVLIIMFMNDPFIEAEAPLWVKMLVYTAMSIFSALFNVDNPTILKIANEIGNILLSDEHPKVKLRNIEFLFPQLSKLWDKINTSLGDDQNEIK